MATYYSQKSGNASDMTVWNTVRGGGGSAPANFAALDNNTLVIQGAALGHAVVWDGDGSGWSNGVAGLTIEGGASPGMLSFKSDADGTYCLPVKSATTIAGTTVTNRGRLMLGGGTWGSPAELNDAASHVWGRQHIIKLMGTSSPAKIDASNLDIQATRFSPTNKYVRVYTNLITVTGINTSTGVITCDSVPAAWTTDTPVQFTTTGTMPGTTLGDGTASTITADTTYYLANVTTGASGHFTLKGYSGTMPAIVFSSAGSGTVKCYDGLAAGAGPTVNVLDDVTADYGWSATSGQNYACIVNGAPAAVDQQRLQITAITSTTMTLSSTVTTAKLPGSRIYLSSRNVSVQCSGTSSTAAMVDWGAATFQNPQPINWELRNTAGSGTTFYGAGYYGGSGGHTFGGTISGLNRGVDGTRQNHTINANIIACATGAYNGGSNETINGHIAGCSIGIGTGNNHTVSSTGLLFGCSYGFNASTGPVVAGTIAGSQHGIYACTGPTTTNTSVISCCAIALNTSYTSSVGGIVRNCGTADSNGGGELIAGRIYQCSIGLGQCRGSVVSAAITDCADGLSGGSGVLRGAVFANNLNEDMYIRAGNWVGYAASLRSATQCSGYNLAAGASGGFAGLCIYDIADSNGVIQKGQLKAWMPGGTVAAITSSIPSSFPGPQSYVHKMQPVSVTVGSQTYYYPCYIDIPIAATNGVPIVYTVWIQKDTHAMYGTPKAQLIDLTKPWGDANETLATTTMADTENSWQTLTVSYTPDHDMQMALRVRCRGSSGNVWWNYQRVHDYPAVANVLKDVSYGNAIYTGTFDEAARNTNPGESNVWNGTSFKIQNVSKTGTKRASSITNCSAGNILVGVVIDDVTGTFNEAARNTDPGIANVWHGTSYKIANSTLTGTKVASSITNCAAGNVKSGVAIDDVTGTFTHTSDYVAISGLPAVGYVYSGTDRGDGNTGTLTLPTAATVYHTASAFGIGGNSVTPAAATYSEGQSNQLSTDQATVASSVAYIQSGHSILGQSGTLDTEAIYASGESAGAASQLALDTSAVNAAKSSLSSTVTLLGVTGTLNLSLYTLISGVIDAQYVLTGYSNYSGGLSGTLTLPSASYVYHTTSPFGIGGTSVTPLAKTYDEGLADQYAIDHQPPVVTGPEPFSIIYDALWALLESSPTWCELVPPGCRIKYSDPKDGSPRLDEALTKDRPQIQIICSQLTPYYSADSSAMRIEPATFEIHLLSGDQRFNASLFPIFWETMRALASYEALLTKLTWNGGPPFVKRLQAKTFGIGLRKIEVDNNTRWWTGIWAVDLSLWFPTLDVKLQLPYA